MSEDISEALLKNLYLEEMMSTRDIAMFLNETRGKIEHLLEKYNIPRRSVSEAQRLTAARKKRQLSLDSRLYLEDALKEFKDTHIMSPIIRPRNLLVPISLASDKDCTVTVVVSDTHIGDANFMIDTFWSTIVNIHEVISSINGLYKIKRLNLVLNGDIVSGRDVYRFQELRNIVQRGHWQVFLAELIFKTVIGGLEDIHDVDNIYLVKGTHESLANNFILFLKRLLDKNAKYLSRGGIVNLAEGTGDKYNVMFTHGYGYTGDFPVSSQMFKDILKLIHTYNDNGIHVNRICSSHSHWLTTNCIINNLYWDITGGFQKWELSLDQRPSGAIVYLYNAGECVAIPVRPDPRTEVQEQRDPGLEYKNMAYYGNLLLKHLTEIENIGGQVYE